MSLADSVMPLISFPLAGLDAGRGAPEREGELLNGGAARYRLYRCADGKFVTLGAIEPKFWAAFGQQIMRQYRRPRAILRTSLPRLVSLLPKRIPST